MPGETLEFDPIRYKETTRRQWDAAAEAWNRWSPTISVWLDAVTGRMFEMAGLAPGCRVLDVAAGAGEQTLLAARRVGPEGCVLATDLSARILEFAAAAAREQGLDHVETRVLDAEDLDVAGSSFDVVLSRLGFMYFPDTPRALAGMHRALAPGGRVAAIVYSTAERNAFISIPVSIIRDRARLPPAAPGQPGPFSLGGQGALAAALERAGFREVRTTLVQAPIRMGSAAECARFERESFGALHQMMEALTVSEKLAVWSEIERELRRFETSEGFVGPCEMVVGVGMR